MSNASSLNADCLSVVAKVDCSSTSETFAAGEDLEELRRNLVSVVPSLGEDFTRFRPYFVSPIKTASANPSEIPFTEGNGSTAAECLTLL